jgi:23S rRNA (cytosine1962-C5)-methyltransferase
MERIKLSLGSICLQGESSGCRLSDILMTMSLIDQEARQFQVLTSPDWRDYQLLDSGDGRKLERFGRYRLVRPEVEAMWKPALPEKTWEEADAAFHPTPEEMGGHWVRKNTMPDFWQIGYKPLTLQVQLSASRHVGLFPEQASSWDWISDQVKRAPGPVRILNLFGYTGCATLAAAAAGASVTHVDASRKVIQWAQQNQQLSGLGSYPIRWIVDDALKFTQREARRNMFYDGLILDPPKFGRGPKGEVWEFYRLLPELLSACRIILKQDPLFVCLTAYAVKGSSLTLGSLLGEVMKGITGRVESGEIALVEGSAGRILSTAIFARWFVPSLTTGIGKE